MSLLLLLLLFSLSSALEVISDRLERLPDGTIRAEGEVEVFYETYYIKADIIRYFPERRQVYAEGRVYIRSMDGKLEVRGKEAYLDLKEEVGYFIDAEGRFEKFNFTAKKVEKEKEVYRVEEGSITTCPPDKKEMNLCFSRARISERYVFSVGNSLNLFRIPIAYLPISIFPVGERRSGLLPPLIGSNTYNGIIYQQPLYWAISKDKDATLTLDFRDRQAKGLSVEYRQAINRSIDLMGLISVYREPTPPGRWWDGRELITFKENRYRLKFDLDLDNLKLGVDTLSDPYFMEDVYFHTADRTVPYLSSYVSYIREWDRFMLVFDLKRFYDTTSEDNRKTLQRLPEVGFYLKSFPLLPFLYFDLQTSYANFYREEGLRSHRLLFFPQLHLQKNLLGRTLLTTLTLENLFYINTEGGNYENRSVVGSLKFTERAPFFYDTELGKLKVKNLLDLSFQYRPRGYNNPRFDPLDEIEKLNQIGISLRSYAYYGDRSVYTINLESGYTSLGRYSYGGKTLRGNLLPLKAQLAFYPFEWLRLSSDMVYSLEDSRLLKNVSSLSLLYGNTEFSLGEALEKDGLGNKLNDQLSLYFSTGYANTRLGFKAVRDRNIDRYIQKQLNLDYMGACWSLGLLLRDIYDGNKKANIKEVFLVFNLFDLQRFTVPLKR
ncbi:MAG: LPS-assembly protein LptD [Acidobacteria bacterium]|nr:MAG: LPS-assembly protein LptD [Acidobacteriota bacterium]